MKLSELQQYTEWIGMSPVDILRFVLAAGGWNRVFPMSKPFPEWASQVRNFFNMTPVTLTLLASPQAKLMTASIKNHRRLGYDLWDRTPPHQQVQEKNALRGDVYFDENGRSWFEMDKLSTIYHFRGNMRAKMDYAFSASYSDMPIFKYISPDDTDGSMELCVYNRKRQSTFGKVGEPVKVSSSLVRDEVYRGSYNYAETIIRGIREHEFRDVESHKDHLGFYVNPPLYSSISSRRFPANDDYGKPLYRKPSKYEKGMEPYYFDSKRGDDSPVRPTDYFAKAMGYPPGDREEELNNLFRSILHPKDLLARIQQRKANDKAANDFHKLPANTKSRLLQILKERAPV